MSQDAGGEVVDSQQVCSDFWNSHFAEIGGTPVEVSLASMLELHERGVTTETFLDFVVSKGYFLHGSRTNISSTDRIKSSKNRLYGTNLGVIGLYKAIFSNKGVSLMCPYFISEAEPMVMKIKGCQPDTIGSKGYVYVIDHDTRFKNDPEGSWQYYIEGDVDLPILAKIEVRREDFVYPIKFVE